MIKRLVSDTYQVNQVYPMDILRQKSLYTLYMPLLSCQAISLYFLLTHEGESNQPSLHSRLTKTCGLTLEGLNEAFYKLEAVGLLRCYENKENQVSFYYEVMLPMTPKQFFAHQILNTLLYRTIGKEEYLKTKQLFLTSTYNKNQYTDVTASFNEVFDISLLDGTIPLSIKDSFVEAKEVHFESFYDMELFYQGLSDYQIPKQILTNDSIRLIQQLGSLYQINNFDMLVLVKQQVHMNQLDHQGLREACRAFYEVKVPQNFNHINHVQSLKHKDVVTSDGVDKHIDYLQTVSPYRLLQDKLGGKEPLKRDLTVVESILTSLDLQPGVMNVLIEFTLKECEGALPRSFMEYYAAIFKRKKITTVKAAMDECKMIMQKQNEPKTTTSNPVWNNTSTTQIDEEEIDIDDLMAKFS